MVQDTHGFDFLITLWHSEQVKMRRLRRVTCVTKFFIAGWWSGCSKSEFGMAIVASRLQQMHDRRPCLRRSLFTAQGSAFEMHCGIVDSAGCHVVVEPEALFHTCST